MYPLLAASTHVFEDGRAYLSQLSAADYARPLNCLSGATIGQHTRHWIEFFQCLFWQIRDGKTLVCYDNRKRDRRLETDPEAARLAISHLEELMGTLDTQQSLNLHTKVGTETINCPTSLGREWWYAVEHAIHHLAIIKIGVTTGCQEIILPDNFGLAHSTKQYRAQAQ